MTNETNNDDYKSNMKNIGEGVAVGVGAGAGAGI